MIQIDKAYVVSTAHIRFVQVTKLFSSMQKNLFLSGFFTLQIFSNEMELNTTQMLDTLALGEKVKKDPKLTQKRKDEVVEHLNSLTARWDRIKDFVALRKERYATHTGVGPYLKVITTFSNVSLLFVS